MEKIQPQPYAGQRVENITQAMKPLIITIAKECVSADYGTDRPLSVFIGAEETEFADILEVHKPNKVVTGITFGLK